MRKEQNKTKKGQKKESGKIFDREEFIYLFYNDQ